MAWSRTSGATLVAGIVFLLVSAGTEAAGSQALLLLNSGMAHERLGQHEEALADFGRALAAGGLSKADRVRTTFDCGVAQDALNRTGEAISEYSAALKLDARFAPALNNRANAYRRLGRLADAKNDYMAALASAQTAREYPYYGLGRIAEAQGDTKAARKYFVQALAANPGYVPASQSLAVLPNQLEPASFVLHPPGKAPAAQPSPDVIVLRPPAKAAAPRQVDAIVLHKPPQKHAPSAPQHVAGRSPDPMLRDAIVDARTYAESSLAEIQLGAFRDQASATSGWKKIVAEAKGLLDGQSPRIMAVDIPGKGRLWRLRTNAADKAAAHKLCAALVARGLACMTVKD